MKSIMRLVAIFLLIGLIPNLTCACGYPMDTTPETKTETTRAPSATTPMTGTATTTTVQKNPDLVGAYLVVIDHLITDRRITVPPFKYLAVDTTKLPGLTASDKARLFKELEKYRLQLLDKTYDELEAEGYIEKTRFTDGASIDLKDIRVSGLVMTLDASIRLAGLNAYGLDDFDVSYLGTHWEITRTYMTWVA